MANRKRRTVTFKEIKDAITTESGADTLTDLQQLSTGEYLVETTSADLAEDLIKSGFNCNDQHVACNLPRSYYTNISIMGLRAYVEDETIIKALTQYGEIKSDVIRLTYKLDHDLAGLENGNRLIRVILLKPSIPYSIKIGNEWCRIIHNNQQPICSECSEIGHSRWKCNGHGHVPWLWPTTHFSPPDPSNQKEENTENTAHERDITEPEPSVTPQTEQTATTFNSPSTGTTTEPTSPQQLCTNTKPQDMDLDDLKKGQKRAHITDSDSDNIQHAPPCRSRITPTPNLSARKPRTSKATKK